MTDLPPPTITYDDDGKQKYQSITATANIFTNEFFLTEIDAYGADKEEAHKNLIAMLNSVLIQLNTLIHPDQKQFKIYQITRDDNHMSTDVNDSYVIVALTEADVKALAASNARDEGADIWLYSSRVTLLGYYSGPLDYSHIVSTEGRDG